jgi:hypothetical protein
MTSFKRLATLAATGGLALTFAVGASATANASVRSRPMLATTGRILAAKHTVLRPGGPMIRATGGKFSVRSAASDVPTISENWSGYAALAGKTKFSDVHSEFIQPAVTCPGAPDQLTSNWVGLDGFSDQTVEQDGTFAECGGPQNETPIYWAWYEMYPLDSVNVFRVKPGDIIEASVQYARSTGMFNLAISDVTTGKSGGLVTPCITTCNRSSAEWIIERPAGCDASGCFLFALADFGTTTMTDDTAKAGVTSGGPNDFSAAYPIYMINPLKSGGFISLDSTGRLHASTDGFTETWNRAGKPLPITLSTRR